ncbi:HAD family hydrolase [Streptomyces aculeolatus]
MIRTLFETPSFYRTSSHQAAAPVPPLRAVLFDFSNTIFQLIEVEEWLRRVGEASGRAAALGEEGAVDGIVAQLRDAGRLPEVVALQDGRDLSRQRHREAMYGWWGHVDFLRGAEEAAYEVLRAPDAWLPYADTGPVLRHLRERGVRIGIVSDIAWDLRIHLAYQGFDELVDTCVMSYEAGREKPDPQLFLKACADLGADPRATLMVGDNPVRDGGATACGLRTYVLPAEHRTGERGLDAVLAIVDASG